MGKTFITVKGKTPFLASARFFQKKDLGRKVIPFSVKRTEVKGLFEVGLKF